jgi:hypothetical protein
MSVDTTRRFRVRRPCARQLLDRKAIETAGEGAGDKVREHAVRESPLETANYLDGYVSEQGGHLGVKTPINDKIAELVNAPGVGLLKPDPKYLDPLRAMVPHKVSPRGFDALLRLG